MKSLVPFVNRGISVMRMKPLTTTENSVKNFIGTNTIREGDIVWHRLRSFGAMIVLDVYDKPDINDTTKSHRYAQVYGQSDFDALPICVLTKRQPWVSFILSKSIPLLAVAASAVGVSMAMNYFKVCCGH